jgi:hypothetical protein
MDVIENPSGNPIEIPIENPEALLQPPADTSIQNEEDLKCMVCYDGDVYAENEILICEKCDVAVHQKCYDIPIVPDGDWFCDVCSTGADAKIQKCELCSYTGESYKMTDAGAWTHSICSNWIPEIYVKQAPDGKIRPTLLGLDKKRFKLKCSVCTRKGACVQCAYGRCTAAVHPWCVYHNPQGFVKRVVKDEDGDPIWEIFCKAHQKCLTEPVKPRPKPKYTAPVEPEPTMEHRIVDLPIRQNRAPRKLSMSHSLRYGRAVGSSSNNATGSNIDLTGMNSQNGSSSSSTSVPKKEFPILSMNEWPGQNEGEPLDLDHFWKVIGMGFPKDHSREWLQFMLAPIQQMLSSNRNDLLSIPDLGHYASIDNNNAIGIEIADAMLANMGTDRERQALLDEEKWDQAHENIGYLIKKLLDCVANDGNLSQIGESGESGERIGEDSSQSSLSPSRQTQSQPGHSCKKAPSALPSENDFLIKNSHATGANNNSGIKAAMAKKANNSTMANTPNKKASSGVIDDDHIRLVIDGPEGRCSVDYQVKLREISATSSKGNDWKKVKLTTSDDDDIYHGLIPQFIAPAEINDDTVSKGLNGTPSKSKAKSSSKKDLIVDIKFNGTDKINDDDDINLSDRIIIPKSHDDMICRMLHSETRAYENIMDACTAEIHRVLNSAEWKSTLNTNNENNRIEWNNIGKRYIKQRVWKKVANTIIKGNRDQKSDFNKAEDDDVPASWAIRVDGRPEKPIEPEEDDESEDAVCMVCFDGSSSDTNSILFCDGCNAALHQSCYGVSEIPEGDFFCDRCKGIHNMATDPSSVHLLEDTRGAIMCCLCPLQHGGIKPTTDGRYVHLCCAMWQNQTAIITDLSDMSPVDVSNIPIQCVTEKINGMVPQPNGSKYFPYRDPCHFCNISGGALRSCSCNGCSVVFHPLCAWFAGLYISATITDETFQGDERQGNYPCGVEYTFSCDAHEKVYSTPQG